MNSAGIGSYIAIGDSLSEGLGDRAFEYDRLHCGWTDRLAHLLSVEAELHNRGFKYANLALRGSKTRSIMTSQLEAALRQKPDFVTVMAGSNDIFAKGADFVEVERLLRHGLTRLTNAGIRVLVVNTADPRHLRLTKNLRPKSKRMTQLINRVCAELSLPILDIHSSRELADIRYWCEDMAHFSEYGHTLIANLAASQLGLDARHLVVAESSMSKPNRNAVETAKWLQRDVVPFLIRRVRGRSSGDGLKPKLPLLTAFSVPEAGVEVVRLEKAAKTTLRTPAQTARS